jgi:DNA-binding NarL/FixJ family response regulator
VSDIRVVIVDDDDLVRTGLRLILGGASDLAVVGEAADGLRAVEVAREAAADVVLMDIRMPRMDGLDATREILAAPGAPRVIVLTTVDTDEMVLEALRLGASGFLLKSTRPERLVDAVRAVVAGEPILSPSVTAQLIASVRDGGTDHRRTAALHRLASLTEREHEVAVAIGRGWSNADIAHRLYMSVPTVKAHVSRLLTKLGAQNRTQVALVVHDAGLTGRD